MNKDKLHRDIDSIKRQYHDFVFTYSAQKEKLDKQSLLISIARFSAFIGASVIVYFAFKTESSLYWIIGLALLLLFVFLMQLHSKLLKKRTFLSKLISINEKELLSLDGDNSSFDNGAKFQIDYHDFSLDLDIFGEQSVYQMINRSVTSKGASVLAAWFNLPLLAKTEILNRQQATSELSSLLEYRQSFAAKGMMVEEKTKDFDFLIDWQNQTNLFFGKSIFKILILLIPIINIANIFLYSFDFIGGKILGLTLVLTLVFVGFYQKKIQKIHQRLSRRSQLLGKYVSLFEQIENADFNSDLLNVIQKNIITDKKKASVAIKDLSKILSALDSRLNVIMGVILNSIFAWDIRQVYRMEAWKGQYAANFNQWFNSIGEFDALLSLANLQYNKVDWNHPSISDDNVWQITEMRHPLMAQSECVANDFSVQTMPFIKVVTGANMAGKSTYLRSVGSNLVLAMIGAVVNAKLMSFHPLQIVSSLRTSDSLMSGESYFYAEIKRLQMIVNRLKSGEKVFVLLDEILKGTNSNDKEQGSRSLLEQLIKLNTIGVIATHDLSLGNLSSLYPNAIENQCFEVDIIDDQLSFDYKIRPGVAQNMNASFLLKKMGIVG